MSPLVSCTFAFTADAATGFQSVSPIEPVIRARRLFDTSAALLAVACGPAHGCESRPLSESICLLLIEGVSDRGVPGNPRLGQWAGYRTVESKRAIAGRKFPGQSLRADHRREIVQVARFHFDVKPLPHHPRKINPRIRQFEPGTPQRDRCRRPVIRRTVTSPVHLAGRLIPAERRNFERCVSHYAMKIEFLQLTGSIERPGDNAVVGQLR